MNELSEAKSESYAWEIMAKQAQKRIAELESQVRERDERIARLEKCIKTRPLPRRVRWAQGTRDCP